MWAGVQQAFSRLGFGSAAHPSYRRASLLPITELPLSACHAVTAGYECEPYNNPADFFLDIINGDSTAVMVNKTNEDNSGTRQRAECSICHVSAARCPAQHRHIPHSARQVVTVLYMHTVI